MDYDSEYDGWLIGNEYAVDFFYKNENTYLNPKKLESSLVYWQLDDEVNEKFVYAHSYIDKDNKLKCKYCNETITVEGVTI